MEAFQRRLERLLRLADVRFNMEGPSFLVRRASPGVKNTDMRDIMSLVSIGFWSVSLAFAGRKLGQLLVGCSGIGGPCTVKCCESPAGSRKRTTPNHVQSFTGKSKGTSSRDSWSWSWSSGSRILRPPGKQLMEKFSCTTKFGYHLQEPLSNGLHFLFLGDKFSCAIPKIRP